MVPTLEAKITRQILYSAVPPIGIASARLAMLPPVELRAGCWDAPRLDRLRGRGRETHLYSSGYSLPLNPTCGLATRDASLGFSGGRALERPVHIRLCLRCQEMT